MIIKEKCTTVNVSSTLKSCADKIREALDAVDVDKVRVLHELARRLRVQHDELLNMEGMMVEPQESADHHVKADGLHGVTRQRQSRTQCKLAMDRRRQRWEFYCVKRCQSSTRTHLEGSRLVGATVLVNQLRGIGPEGVAQEGHWPQGDSSLCRTRTQ